MCSLPDLIEVDVELGKTNKTGRKLLLTVIMPLKNTTRIKSPSLKPLRHNSLCLHYSTLCSETSVQDTLDMTYGAVAKEIRPTSQQQHQGSRGSCGPQMGVNALRVPGAVVEVSNSLYRLRTSAGALHTCYRSDDLELFQGQVGGTTLGWYACPKVSLREGCRHFNRRTSSTSRPAISCQCK
eukprot:scpid106992/ scgid35656/ 